MMFDLVRVESHFPHGIASLIIFGAATGIIEKEHGFVRVGVAANGHGNCRPDQNSIGCWLLNHVLPVFQAIFMPEFGCDDQRSPLANPSPLNAQSIHTFRISDFLAMASPGSFPQIKRMDYLLFPPPPPSTGRGPDRSTFPPEPMSDSWPGKWRDFCFNHPNLDGDQPAGQNDHRQTGKP